MRLIEAEHEGRQLYPVRGRSCSSNAIPVVGERFESYHDFALASLSEIYTAESLQRSHLFSTNTLESGILINDGRGHFEFRVLPRIAQASPSFGVVTTELDGDGIADIFLAQNFFGPQVETGRMDGGVGLLLRGQVPSAQNSGFTPIWPDRSGIVVSGDATSALCTDANQDGRPDLLVAENNGRIRSFLHQAENSNSFLSIDVKNQRGAPAVGA
ncbi:MAG: VCBS repeat-containing protein, partial [Planctomycetaceae bacterium]|nr:VCBS repeat-containing protein [Planctomycetaceae bacterium]